MTERSQRTHFAIRGARTHDTSPSGCVDCGDRNARRHRNAKMHLISRPRTRGRNIDGDGTRLLRWPHCRGGSTVQAEIVQAAGHGWDDIGAADRVVPFLLARLAPTSRPAAAS